MQIQALWQWCNASHSFQSVCGTTHWGRFVSKALSWCWSSIKASCQQTYYYVCISKSNFVYIPVCLRVFWFMFYIDLVLTASLWCDGNKLLQHWDDSRNGYHVHSCAGSAKYKSGIWFTDVAYLPACLHNSEKRFAFDRVEWMFSLQAHLACSRKKDSI